ncbi:unnamed protein product [Symbiodinium microadriaticum]|nr:unnamed protein product [Symbiodinium microadriaticum]
MGKNDQWDQGGSGSRYWRGSYNVATRQPWRQPSKGKEKGNYRDAEAAPGGGFPAYDSRPLPKSKARPDRMDSALTSPGTELLPSLQKALNVARKAETRLQKLVQERSSMEEMWKRYLVDHKAAYLREKARHVKAMEASERDIEAAKFGQVEARESVRETVLREMHVGQTTIEQAADMEWDTMVQGWEEEQRGQIFGVLQRAMQAERCSTGESYNTNPHHLPARRGTCPSETASAMPPEDTAGHPAMAERHMARSPDTPAKADPYMPSSPVPTLPNMTTGAPLAERRSSPIHPGQREPGQARHPTSEEAPRPSIKAATSAPSQVANANPPGVNLADKLQARRSAMEPFGRPPHRDPTEELSGPVALGPPTGPSEAELAIEATRRQITQEREVQIDQITSCNLVPSLARQHLQRKYALGFGITFLAFFSSQAAPPPSLVYGEERAIRASVAQGHEPWKLLLQLRTSASAGIALAIWPQLHSGMCTFLRFPSTARGGDSRPIVAVIVDLSCAGGHCYASYMSRATDYEDFMDFIYPQIRDDDQLVVYVGDNPDPVPPRRPLQLQDGDVISVRRTSYLAVPTAAAIVEDRSSWIPPHHVPQASQSEGVLVQYQDSQFFLQPYRHSGSTITEAIANRIGRPLSALTMCCFKTPDLELQGDWCGRLVMVVDLPPEQATACWRSRRRDVFILCDLRPVGQRMKIMHCHTPILHLPSVAALHHVYVPPYTRLTAIGGTVQGDEISTDGHSVLTFYLEPDSDDEDDTPGPGPPGPPRGRGTTSGPDDDSSEGDPPTSERPYRQSWPATDCSRRSRSRSADIPPGRHRGPQDCLDKALRTIFDREASEPGAMPPVEADAATVASVTDIMRSHGGHLDSHAYVACKGPAGPRLGTRATQVGEAAGQGRELAALEPETPYPAQPPDLQVEQPGQNLAEAVEDGRIEATCLIYAPGYVPDILAARLPIPCSVNHAVTQFVRGRDAGQAECFDQVFPASPQPAPNLAVLVASPSWMQDKVVVLFNCLAVNQMLFAAAVHPYLNKASILAAAGANLNGALREHGQLDVYIFGLLRPLDDAQWVTMRSGMSVCCVPAGQGPVPGWNLDDMLQDATDWTHNPALPGPPPAPGQHYLVLTDAMPYLFQVTPGRRRFLKQDVAQLLQCEAHSLSLVPTTPRVIDGISFGLPFWTVLVATEQLQTIPCPPARHPEHRLILILDCRAILLGFQWRLLTQPTVPAQELADQFADRCPASHLVVFRGADMHHSAEGLSLEVSHGQIIKVEFAAESAASSDSDAADDDPQGSDISMRSSEPPGTHTDASHDDLERLDSRSRSPRSGMPNPALGDDQPAPTASKVCTFGILAPGLSIESVVVSLSTPASMHDTVRALQTAREADYARALPLLQAVRHQPDTRWGLLIISVPIWGYTEAVVCIDMTSSWSRVFAVCLPVKASRPRVLAAAGLSAAADVDLFLNGDSPIEDFVDLHDGDCITVLWSGYGPSPRQDLADLLDGPWRTAAIPAFPTETEPDHYLLVGVDGCTWTALHRFITDVT